nr:hypothetical protein [Tanacetum cinerariifolium]
MSQQIQTVSLNASDGVTINPDGGDHICENEVELVDNNMAHSMASESVGFGTNSLLEQWKDSYKNGDYDEDPTMMILGNSKPFDTLVNLGSCVNLIPLYLFKKLKIKLLEETNLVFGLANETKSYPIGIVKNVEVHIGWLKHLEDFYVIDIEKDLATPLLLGRGFLATDNVMIDYRKAKIAVGEEITRSIFVVKEIDLDDKEIPYWTTLEKRDSYTPRPGTDGIGAQTPYYAKKYFTNYRFPDE